MTIEEPVWEASETIFVDQEYAMTNFRGEFINNETIIRGRSTTNPLYISEDHAVDFIDDDNFKALIAKVNVVKVGEYKVRHGVTLESLHQKWLISPEAARITVQHTTQRVIRKILHPSLS